MHFASGLSWARRVRSPAVADVEEVRDAELSEVRALEALQLRASLVWEEDRDDILAHPEVIEVPLDAVRQRRVRVAVGDGAVLGFSVVVPAGAGLELDGLFVEPHIHRGGVGRVLVADVVESAVRDGASRLEVTANPRALGFYQRVGFVADGEVPTRFRPALRMHLDLDPAHVELLHGGVANAGAVVRVGPHVLRPSSPNTATIHAVLRHLRDQGFTGASEPVGIDPDGRERMVFIPGDVPVPPYAAWAQTDEALASVAELLGRYHRAVRGFEPPPDATWSPELADPEAGASAAGRVITHNDVCLENVVFREGRAVAFVDFDFAAPGRSLYDVVQMARMCVPVDDEVSARGLGWGEVDPFSRLRLVADAYGLPPDRSELLAILAGTIERGGEFVRRRVQAGDPGFVRMWEEMGGMERFDRRRRWFAENADRFARALG